MGPWRMDWFYAHKVDFGGLIVMGLKCNDLSQENENRKLVDNILSLFLSKILRFSRQVALKVTKIQTFALFYLDIINEIVVDVGHIPSQSFWVHPSILYQNKLFSRQIYMTE